MISFVRSLWVWTAVGALMLLWLPLLVIVRLFDRDPVRYSTGRWFRRLGHAMTVVNPSWSVHTRGGPVADPRHPYVVVSNHQSHADIPIISILPWEMKWVAKEELWHLPVVGWMLRLAGDVPVRRRDPRSGVRALLDARRYLDGRCSVMFFPEGTRSPDGRVHRFSDGAFLLAIKAGVPVLPLAVEGSYRCLPKKSWQFGTPADVWLHILEPVSTAGLLPADAPALRDRVREAIIARIAHTRGVPPADVDALARQDPV